MAQDKSELARDFCRQASKIFTTEIFGLSDLDRAERYGRGWLECCEKVYGKSSLEVVRSSLTLALIEKKLGEARADKSKIREAREIVARVRQIYAGDASVSNMRRAQVLAELSELWGLEGNDNAMLTDLRQALAICQTEANSDQIAAAEISDRAWRCAALLPKQDFTHRTQVLEQLLAIEERLKPHRVDRIAEVSFVLADLNACQFQFAGGQRQFLAKAAGFYQKSMEAAAIAKPTDQERLISLEYHLAVCQWCLGQLAAAHDSWERCQDRCREFGSAADQKLLDKLKQDILESSHASSWSSL